MPRTDSRHDALYSQLRRRMIEHREWDRLSFMLADRLNESGWLDNLRHRSKELARDDTMTAEAIMAQLRDHAESSVSSDIKQDMTLAVRRCVEKYVEGS